jgi:spore germination protein GerM
LTVFNALFPPLEKGSTAITKEKILVTLYFSDSNERFLAPEKRLVPQEQEGVEQAKILIKALLKGSEKGLVNTFPEQTELKDVKIDKDGTAYVNFDKGLIEHHPGGSASEVATLYSLTNSLTYNLPQIKRVKVLIDGKEKESLKGHVDTRYPLVFNKDIITESSK